MRDPRDTRLTPIHAHVPEMSPRLSVEQRMRFEELDARLRLAEMATGGVHPLIAAMRDPQILAHLQSGQVTEEHLRKLARVVESNQKLESLTDRLRNQEAPTPGMSAFLTRAEATLPERAEHLAALEAAQPRIERAYEEMAIRTGKTPEEVRAVFPGLSGEQLNYATEVVENPQFQGLLEAGPGTGKTETLGWTFATAVAQGKMKPSQVIVTSTTNATMEVLKKRFLTGGNGKAPIASLFPEWDVDTARREQFRTLHSIALSMLHQKREIGEGRYRSPMEAMGMGGWTLVGSSDSRPVNDPLANLEARVRSAETGQQKYFTDLLKAQKIRDVDSQKAYEYISWVKSNQGNMREYPKGHPLSGGDQGLYQNAMRRGALAWKEGRRSELDALLYFYEQNLHQAPGFSGGTGQKGPQFDLFDTIHYWAQAGSRGLTKQEGGVFLDEMQDATLDMLRGVKANIAPGRPIIFGGDVGQQVLPGVRNNSKMIPRLFPGITQGILTANYRSGRNIVAFSNATAMSKEMQREGAGPFQVGMKEELGQVMYPTYMKSFDDTYRLMARDALATMEVDAALLQKNVLEGKAPLSGARVAPASVPLVFQMKGRQGGRHGGRSHFLRILEEEVRDMLTTPEHPELARQASAVTQAMVYPVQQTPRFGDADVQDLLHAVTVPQIKGWGVPYVLYDFTQGGKWSEAGFKRNLGIASSRAEKGFALYGAGENFPGYEFPLEPERHPMYEEPDLPRGVLPILVHAMRNAVGEQGVDPTQLEDWQRALLSSQPSLRGEEQGVPFPPEVEAFLERFATVYRDIRPFYQAPPSKTAIRQADAQEVMGGETPGIGGESVGMPGYSISNSLEAMLEVEPSEIKDPHYLPYLRRTMEEMARTGKSLSGLPLSIPESLSALEQLVKPLTKYERPPTHELFGEGEVPVRVAPETELPAPTMFSEEANPFLVFKEGEPIPGGLRENPQEYQKVRIQRNEQEEDLSLSAGARPFIPMNIAQRVKDWEAAVSRTTTFRGVGSFQREQIKRFKAGQPHEMATFFERGEQARFADWLHMPGIGREVLRWEDLVRSGKRTLEEMPEWEREEAKKLLAGEPHGMTRLLEDQFLAEAREFGGRASDEQHMRKMVRAFLRNPFVHGHERVQPLLEPILTSRAMLDTIVRAGARQGFSRTDLLGESLQARLRKAAEGQKFSSSEKEKLAGQMQRQVEQEMASRVMNLAFHPGETEEEAKLAESIQRKLAQRVAGGTSLDLLSVLKEVAYEGMRAPTLGPEEQATMAAFVPLLETYDAVALHHMAAEKDQMGRVSTEQEGITLSQKEREALRERNPREEALLAHLLKKQEGREVASIQEAFDETKQLPYEKSKWMRGLTQEEGRRLRLPPVQSRLAPARAEMEALAYNLERTGLTDPAHRENKPTGLEAYQKRLRDLGHIEEAMGVKRFRGRLHDPRNQERWGHAINTLLRLTTGHGAFLRGKEGEEGSKGLARLFRHMKIGNHGAQARTLEQVQEFIDALDEMTTHMNQTGMLKREHVDTVLAALGHDRQSIAFARDFPALAILEQEGKFGTPESLLPLLDPREVVDPQTGKKRLVKSLYHFFLDRSTQSQKEMTPEQRTAEKVRLREVADELTRVPITGENVRRATFLGGHETFPLFKGQEGVLSAGMTGWLYPLLDKEKQIDERPQTIATLISKGMLTGPERDWSKQLPYEVKGQTPYQPLFFFQPEGSQERHLVRGDQVMDPSLVPSAIREQYHPLPQRDWAEKTRARRLRRAERQARAGQQQNAKEASSPSQEGADASLPVPPPPPPPSPPVALTPPPEEPPKRPYQAPEMTHLATMLPDLPKIQDLHQRLMTARKQMSPQEFRAHLDQLEAALFAGSAEPGTPGVEIPLALQEAQKAHLDQSLRLIGVVKAHRKALSRQVRSALKLVAKHTPLPPQVGPVEQHVQVPPLLQAQMTISPQPPSPPTTGEEYPHPLLPKKPFELPPLPDDVWARLSSAPGPAPTPPPGNASPPVSPSRSLSAHPFLLKAPLPLPALPDEMLTGMSPLDESGLPPPPDNEEIFVPPWEENIPLSPPPPMTPPMQEPPLSGSPPLLSEKEQAIAQRILRVPEGPIQWSQTPAWQNIGLPPLSSQGTAPLPIPTSPLPSAPPEEDEDLTAWHELGGVGPMPPPPPGPPPVAKTLADLSEGILSGNPLWGIVAPSSAQKRAITSKFDQDLMIIGGPGGGKSETMASRLAYEVAEKQVKPREILPLSQVKAGVTAFNEKLETYRQAFPRSGGEAYRLPHARSFHSLFWNILMGRGTPWARYLDDEDEGGDGRWHYPVLEEMGVQFSGRVLPSYFSMDQEGLSPTERRQRIEESDYGFLTEALRTTSEQHSMRWLTGKRIKEYLKYINKVKADYTGSPHDEYPQAWQAGHTRMEEIQEAVREGRPEDIHDHMSKQLALYLYEQKRHKEGHLDFSDMPILAGRFLSEKGEKGLPTGLKHIKRVAIDEAQDASKAILSGLNQFRNALIKGGNPVRLLVGGDPMQALIPPELGGIDPNQFVSVYEDIVGGPGHLQGHVLRENFRSDKGTVSLLNSLLGHERLRKEAKSPVQRPTTAELGSFPSLELGAHQPALYDKMFESMISASGMTWDDIRQNYGLGKDRLLEGAQTPPGQVPAIFTRHADREIFLHRAKARIAHELGLTSPKEIDKAAQKLFRKNVPLTHKGREKDATLFPLVLHAGSRSHGFRFPHMDMTHVGGGSLLEYLHRLFTGMSRVKAGGRNFLFATNRPFRNEDEARAYVKSPEKLEWRGGQFLFDQTPLKEDNRNVLTSMGEMQLPEELEGIYRRHIADLVEQGIPEKDLRAYFPKELHGVLREEMQRQGIAPRVQATPSPLSPSQTPPAQERAQGGTPPPRPPRKPPTSHGGMEPPWPMDNSDSDSEPLPPIQATPIPSPEPVSQANSSGGTATSSPSSIVVPNGSISVSAPSGTVTVTPPPGGGGTGGPAPISPPPQPPPSRGTGTPGGGPPMPPLGTFAQGGIPGAPTGPQTTQSQGRDKEGEGSRGMGFGFGNVFLQFGRTIARIGSELAMIGQAAEQTTNNALMQGGDYRLATLSILQMTPQGQHDLVHRADRDPGASGFWDFNGGVGTIASLQKNELPMYSRAQIAEGIREYLGATNQTFTGPGPRTDAAAMDMQIAALTGMDPSQVIAQMSAIATFPGAGQHVGDLSNADYATSQMAGILQSTFHGNLTQQNVAPYLQAMESLVPTLSVFSGQNILPGPVPSPLTPITQAATIFQLATDAGIGAQNLPQVAQMGMTLAQVGTTPDLSQQAFLAQHFGEQSLTASPEYFSYLQSQHEQQFQLAGLRLQQQYNVPQLQIRAINAEIQMDQANLSAQQFQLAQGQAQFQFQQYMQTQQLGPIGETMQQTGRAAYFDFLRRQMAAGYDPSNADTASTFKPKGTPFGLQNEQFFAGVEHQRSMLVLGRSPLLADAAFQEQMKFLNSQENFYVRSLALQNEQRQFEKTWTQRALDVQARQLKAAEGSFAAQLALKEVQKAQMELEKTHLTQMVTDLDKLLLEQRQQLAGQGPRNGGTIAPLQIIEQLANEYRTGGAGRDQALAQAAQQLHLSLADQKIFTSIVEQAATMSIPQMEQFFATRQGGDLLAEVDAIMSAGGAAGQQQQAGQKDVSLSQAGQQQAWDDMIASMKGNTAAQENMAKTLSPSSPYLVTLGTVAHWLGPLAGAVGALENIIGTVAGVATGGGAGGAGGASGGGMGSFDGGGLSMPSGGMVPSDPNTDSKAGKLFSISDMEASPLLSKIYTESEKPRASQGVRFLAHLLNDIVQKRLGIDLSGLYGISAGTGTSLGTESHYGLLTPYVTKDFHARMNYGIHQGVDFAASQGTPLAEFVGGTVSAAGWKPWGGEVDVTVPGGLTERYLHLSQISVAPGQKVLKGQHIGLTGGGTPQSGLGYWSSGAHSHIQYDRGSYQGGINPWPIWTAFGEHDLRAYYGNNPNAVNLNSPDQNQVLPPGAQMHHFAQGGIAMTPLRADLAEGGSPEAVIPLSRLKQVMAQVSPTESTPASQGGHSGPCVSIQKLVDTLHVHVHTQSATLSEGEKDQLMADVIDVLDGAITQLAGRLH